MTDQEGLVPTIPGPLHMPGFDKVIMGNNPASAGFTLFYYLTEQHIMSQQLSALKLIMLIPNRERQQQRLGAGNIDIFNCGYVFYQLQLQERRLLSPTAWELGKQLIFDVEPMESNTNKNFIEIVGDIFSWPQGYLWAYSRPTEIQDQRDPRMRSLLQGLLYKGGEVLARLPTATTQHIANLLGNMRPMFQQKFNTDFQYYGAKTVKRIRGSPYIWERVSSSYRQRLMEWINNTNEYREGQQEVEATQELQGPQTGKGLNE